jgi:hypothetical protein
MNQGQLLAASRDTLDDNSEPPLYPHEELSRYGNNAVAEACLRARLLQDDSGDACRIDLEVGVSRYDIAPEVFAVRAVFVASRAEPLIRTTAARLDRIVPGWSHQAQTNGVPKYAVFDVQQKTLTLFPPPATAELCSLRVWRQPSEAERMVEDDDEPVVAMSDPESLKHWILHEAYLKKDGELYDPEKSATHLGLFAERFGPRPDEHTLTLWSTQPITGPRTRQLDY